MISVHTKSLIILLNFFHRVWYRKGDRLRFLQILPSKYEAFPASKCSPSVKDGAQIQRQVISVNKQLS